MKAEKSSAQEEPEYEMFGDIVWPCNCSIRATDQGVTDTSILIMAEMTAMLLRSQYHQPIRSTGMHELGEINGKEVLFNYRRGIFEVSNVWLDACPKTFMMV